MSVQSSSSTKHAVCHATVQHVGDLSGERKPPYFSFEGGGLSVSHHPREWAQLMRSGGALYELSTDESRFYSAAVEGGPREEALAWCVEAGYLEPVTVYEVQWTDESGEKCRLLCYDESTATLEAQSRECGSPTPTEGYTLGPEGHTYWASTFRQDPEQTDPLQVQRLAPVWFAQAHGYDGVWWDEAYAPSKYSLPRGVIFQDALSEWHISQVAENV